jgi:hypothetical protein
MKRLVPIVLLLLGVAPASAALRYRGRAWSDVDGGVRQYRVVFSLTPGWASHGYPLVGRGTIRCRPLSPWIWCLTPVADVAVEFVDQSNFMAYIADGVCTAAGIGSPGNWLLGNYTCVNGDAGTFIFHPVGQ